MNSINGYEFYIVIKQFDKYLISACEFSIVSDYIFQMLKDTHFSCIVDETESVHYEIVVIKHDGTNSIKKQLIIDYYNQGKIVDFIKPILTFNCSKIKNIIKITNHNGFEEQQLTLTNTHRTEYLNQIVDNYSDQTLDFYQCLKNIELSFMVNDYEGKKYISNPTFKLHANYINNLFT